MVKKCPNCGHAIRSTRIGDNMELKHEDNYPYTHVRHEYNGKCSVMGCNCNKIINSDLKEDKRKEKSK